MVIKFAELIAGKLRQAMADIFFDFISPNFKKETEIIKDNIIKIVTKERIGLNYTKKLFIIYGDNILNNNIFYNYLLTLL